MITIWIFLFLVPLLRGLCELGADFGAPSIWPLVATLLAAPVLASISKEPAFWVGFKRSAGLLGLIAAVVLLRRSNLHVLDTRNWADALLLALAGLGSLVAATVPDRERGASPGTWCWIAGWSLTGILNPWLPMLGAALAAGLDSWKLWPETPPADSPKSSLPTFQLAVLLGLALPKPFWDFGFAPQADYSMVAFGGTVLFMAWLRPRLSSLPNWLPVGGLLLLTTLYFPSFPMVSSALLGVAAGSLMPRWSARPSAFLGGMLLGLVLSFALHSNLQVTAIRAWAWWGA